MDQTVEDGVGQRGITHDLVPAIDRHLAGDDQGAAIVAVLDNLQQIAALLGSQWLRSPVVQNEQVDPRELAHQTTISAVTTRQRQCCEQARAALVEDREIFPASLVAQCAGDEALAGAAGAGNQAVPVLTDPITAGQVQEQRPVEATRLAEVDIFDRGGLPKLGGSCACLEPLLLTQRDLLVDQQTEPFRVLEGMAFGIGREVAEPLCHAVEAKFVQAIQCWMVQQGVSPQWK